MHRKRSLHEIGFIFLITYAIASLFIYHYQTSYLLKDTERGFPLLSHILNGNRGKGRGSEGIKLPLTAYLFIDDNDKLSPVVFDAPKYNQFLNKDRRHGEPIGPFPAVDDYPKGDPFLPWIHDTFLSENKVIVIAQNLRRCHTGKNHGTTMKNLEPQIALFQPISLKHQHLTNRDIKDDQVKHQDSQYTVSNDKEATIRETRFQCRFKLYKNSKLVQEQTTFSQYPFNYEYITWRKRMDAMFEPSGKGMAQFWLSSLEFHCPLPSSIQKDIKDGTQLYLDIATIRTPVRSGGVWDLKELGDQAWNVYEAWGRNITVPSVDSSTRWENIRIPLKKPDIKPKQKPHKLVACTWTSATHNRRGDAVTITDGKDRLREWITFNLLVGFDHVVIYDNTAANTNSTSLKEVTDLFDSRHVTRIEWPCKICNNNRPVHDDPGERSSQYAAEASCRARFGPGTEWMANLDPDEYLVPMGKYENWKEILKIIDEDENRKVIKFKSTRARPRLQLLEPFFDPANDQCPSKEKVDHVIGGGIASCLTRKPNVTFLSLFNCDYIKSPKPDRFQRAMKQLYRPDFVLSHFVHYSTVTTDLARRQEDTSGVYRRAATNNPKTERFIDEINEGAMIHAKSITPNEGVSRNNRCAYKKTLCGIGYQCPDDLPFSDETHRDGFVYDKDKYCNCWINQKAETTWIPRLEEALKELPTIMVN